MTTENLMASAALAQAMTLARKGKTAPLREQRSGRLDSRRLARVLTGDLNVYVKRGAPAPDKVRCTILLDASGSMGGHRASLCMQIGRDLAGATEMLPWVTADIVAFTTRGDVCAMYPLWKSGERTDNVDAYENVAMSGTEEGYALAFARDEMLEKRRGREQALIIMISDGGPSEPKHVKAVVEQCKRDRIPVVSIALVRSANQPLMYGKDNVVQYDGKSPRKLARDMAKVMGRVI